MTRPVGTDQELLNYCMYITGLIGLHATTWSVEEVEFRERTPRVTLNAEDILREITCVQWVPRPEAVQLFHVCLDILLKVQPQDR